MPLNEPNTEFLAELATIASVKPAEARYLEEPRGRFVGQGAAVVRPTSVDEVSAVVRLCNLHSVGIVPFGGGTGLVGGQTMSDGTKPIILSMERMNKIREVDASENVLIAEAGVILANIQSAAEGKERMFPLSLASEGSCQIGGNLATNAGGINVLRYGNARDLCLGVEAVLPDGSIYNGLKKLRKDNTGYDLRDLLVGSEGTLGIITAATLRIKQQPAEIEAAFLAIPNPYVALTLLHRLSRHLGEVISAFELIHRQGFDFLTEAGMPFNEPFTTRSDWMILLECGAGVGANLKHNLEAILADAFEGGMILDAVLAQNDSQRQAFWQIRETIPEANRRIGVISSHDISVPVSRVPEFIEQAATVVAGINPNFRINCFGHLGDGNLHYNVYPPKGVKRSEFDSVREHVKTAVYDLVASYGGSFSAEHGIGRMKKADLANYGDPVKIATMRSIKAALDPNGIMNPGAVI